jgi:hypothetical protein
VGGWLLGTRSVAGITLWRTIWLGRNTALEPRLLLHEFRHVQQFQEDPMFPVRYAWESIVRGYGRNRFEDDARRFADRRLGATSSDTPTDA